MKNLLLVLVLLLSACARKADEPVMFTGKVLSKLEMQAKVGVFTDFGKASYAEVSHAWLVWAYADFRSNIFQGEYGVTRWTDKTTCTFFTTAFEAYAQQRYFAQSFHSSITAPCIAVGAQWYILNPPEGHAVNVVVTERGREFFDPQTGEFLQLTPTQIANSILRKFD